MKRLGLVLFAIAISHYSVQSQDRRLFDSLTTQLNRSNSDRHTVDVLNALSEAYWYSQRDTSMNYAERSLDLATKISYLDGRGFALYNMGVVNALLGEFVRAMELTKKAQQIGEETKNDKLIASTHVNMGVIYRGWDNYSEALRHLFVALPLAEKTKNAIIQIWCYNNLAGIYNSLDNYPEALKNEFLSLQLCLGLGDTLAIADVYSEIAYSYSEFGKYNESLRYHFMAQKLNLIYDPHYEIRNSSLKIGFAYQQKGDYTTALGYYRQWEALGREKNNPAIVSSAYGMIAQVFFFMGRFRDAATLLDTCIVIDEASNMLDSKRLSYLTYSSVDSALARSPSLSPARRAQYAAQALEHYKRYIQCRDSLVDFDKKRKVLQQEMQFEYDTKDVASQAEQQRRESTHIMTRNALIAGLASLLISATVLYSRFREKKKANVALEEKNQIISLEKGKSDALLLNILPSEVAEELKEKGSAEARQFHNVTVLFTDFKSFTNVSEHLSPQELVDELHECFRAFDDITTRYNIEKIKTIGDAYLAVGGLPLADENHAVNVVQAAIEIRDFMRARYLRLGVKTFEIRIGVNSGSVVAGIVGVKKFAYDIWGDTVNLAARMEQNSEPGRINVSGSTYEHIKDSFQCHYRGKIAAKNKGDVDMYFVEPFDRSKT